MATPASSVTEYCTLLSRSKLLPADEVESLHRRWRDESGGTDDQVAAFGRFLISNKAVTPWQAALVQRGRAEGFFLDGYKILDQVGKGQMGGVYRAVHTHGQVVAVKILPASRAKDAAMLSRFQREARLLTQLDHPNVVRAFQVGESGGRHYIVMEYLEGETLDEVLTRRGRLPVAEAVRVVRQALDGLQHLHERRMVHRDLKPANLMIVPAPPKGGPDTTANGTVKVLDVGLGRGLFADAGSDAPTEPYLTVEGTVVGTPDYMAPEQSKDARTADVRADIYSLGCVLYQCLTGHTPFPGSTIMALMLKHATEQPAPLADTVADVPAGLQAVLDRFMEKSPDARFQTPEAASQAVKKFLAGSPGATPVGANLTPAYKRWLETESGMEVPVLPPAPPKPSTAKPAAAPAVTGAKPGTAPAPAVAAAKPGTSTAAPGKSPAAPPRKSGTATAAVPAAVTAKPAPPPSPPHVVGSGAHAVAAPAPVAPPEPLAVRVPAPAAPAVEEVEVELVTDLPTAPASQPVYVRVSNDDRALWDLNRRDLFMLVGGGAGVIGALGAGYGLSRLVRAMKSSPADADEKKE